MTIIDKFAAQLTALDLHFDLVKGEAIRMSFAGKNISYRVGVTASGPLVHIWAVPEIGTVDERRLGEVLRLANRLNARNVLWGSFWVDPEERKLTFELVIAAPGEELTREHVGMAIAALHSVDNAFPAFAAVIWAGLSAEQAILALRTADPTQEDKKDDDPDLDIAV